MFCSQQGIALSGDLQPPGDVDLVSLLSDSTDDQAVADVSPYSHSSYSCGASPPISPGESTSPVGVINGASPASDFAGGSPNSMFSGESPSSTGGSVEILLSDPTALEPVATVSETTASGQLLGGVLSGNDLAFLQSLSSLTRQQPQADVCGGLAAGGAAVAIDVDVALPDDHGIYDCDAAQNRAQDGGQSTVCASFCLFTKL